MTTEMETLKTKLRATWIAGDFAEIAKAIERGAVEFVDRLGLRPGMLVLDAACGNGNTVIPSARTGAEVTGIDLAPYLIEQAIARAEVEGVDAEFDIGDVEAMPYDAASFDVVITMFGAMFAPRPELTANELKRVCRSGGMIAMANWTPEGFIGQMFKTTARHLSPPAGMPSPLLWGDEKTVSERFGHGISDLQMVRRKIDFIFLMSPVEVVEHFRLYYGPTQKAFEALDLKGQDELRKDLEDLWSQHNRVADGSTRVESEYLEVKATRI
ncbi:MAG TPA: class I SAM-dependent methyltransferase [Pyrinomonadaceae bacterium]